jgi:hypothetical protein
LSAALSNITETTDHDFLAGQHHVGSSENSIRQGMAASIDVVEFLLKIDVY